MNRVPSANNVQETDGLPAGPHTCNFHLTPNCRRRGIANNIHRDGTVLTHPLKPVRNDKNRNVHRATWKCVPSKQELPWTWLSPAASDKSPVFPIFGKVKEVTPASVGSRGIRDRWDYSR